MTEKKDASEEKWGCWGSTPQQLQSCALGMEDKSS
jgi:hypothetical protein